MNLDKHYKDLQEKRKEALTQLQNTKQSIHELRGAMWMIDKLREAGEDKDTQQDED